MSFAVVIPCRGHAGVVEEAVRSAVEQEGDLEVVVVDDGDGLVLPAWWPVEVVRTAGVGLAGARNAGWRAASGEWVVPLDADDRLAPGYLLALEGASGDVLSPTLQEFGHREERRPPGRVQLESFRWGTCIPGSSVIRRSLLDRLGGWDGSLPGLVDWDLWIRCALAGAAFEPRPEAVYLYRTYPPAVEAAKPYNLHAASFRAELHRRHPEVFA